jgi:hypothetical protein
MGRIERILLHATAKPSRARKESTLNAVEAFERLNTEPSIDPNNPTSSCL